jgi:hypothetical protein
MKIGGLARSRHEIGGANNSQLGAVIAVIILGKKPVSKTKKSIILLQFSLETWAASIANPIRQDVPMLATIYMDHAAVSAELWANCLRSEG